MDLQDQLRTLRGGSLRTGEAADATDAARIVAPINRRNVLNAMGAGVALMAAGIMAGCGSGDNDNVPFNSPVPSPSPSSGLGPAPGLTQVETDTLNFALNLEYLEAEFYSYVTTGRGIDASLTTGQGTVGATTGGSRVAFSDSRLSDTAAELLTDEIAHILLLKSFLGNVAVAKPAINLIALGQGFGSEAEFLNLARSFTDVGTSAYAGGSRFLTTADVRENGARILATEGYHAGNIRYHVVSRGLSVTAVDALDQVPTSSNFFAGDANSLAIARDTTQVGAIVRGDNPAGGKFFPNGLNGNVK